MTGSGSLSSDGDGSEKRRFGDITRSMTSMFRNMSLTPQKKTRRLETEGAGTSRQDKTVTSPAEADLIPADGGPDVQMAIDATSAVMSEETQVKTLAEKERIYYQNLEAFFEGDRNAYMTLLADQDTPLGKNLLEIRASKVMEPAALMLITRPAQDEEKLKPDEENANHLMRRRMAPELPDSSEVVNFEVIEAALRKAYQISEMPSADRIKTALKAPNITVQKKCEIVAQVTKALKSLIVKKLDVRNIIGIDKNIADIEMYVGLLKDEGEAASLSLPDENGLNVIGLSRITLGLKRRELGSFRKALADEVREEKTQAPMLEALGNQCFPVINELKRLKGGGGYFRIRRTK